MHVKKYIDDRVPDCMSHLRKKSAYLYAITAYDNKQRTYRAPKYSVPPLLTDQTGWPSNIFKYPKDNTENIFKYPKDNTEKNFKYLKDKSETNFKYLKDNTDYLSDPSAPSPRAERFSSMYYLQTSCRRQGHFPPACILGAFWQYRLEWGCVRLGDLDFWFLWGGGIQRREHRGGYSVVDVFWIHGFCVLVFFCVFLCLKVKRHLNRLLVYL